MDTKRTSCKTPILWAAVAGLILSAGIVQAEMLSPALYGDELDRCAAGLRTQLDLQGAARVQHNVTDIDKVSAWYVFTIRTTVFDDTDTVMASATTRCKAHRMTPQTVVEVTIQPVVKNARLASVD